MTPERQKEYEAVAKAIQHTSLASDEDGLSLSLLDALRDGYELENVVEQLTWAALEAMSVCETPKSEDSTS